MSAKRCLILIFSTVLYLLLLAGLIGCGATTQPAEGNPVAADGLEITWPPEAIPTRAVSDDEVTLQGTQFSMSEGDVDFTLPDTDVTFAQAEPWTYAMYSLTGFGDGIDLGSIVATYTVEDPVGFEGSTKLYFGVSDYTLGAWSWYLGDPGNPEIVFPNPTNLPSASGDIHVVVVHQGEGTANLVSVSFRRVGDTTLSPPENLVATADVFQIGLTWDESKGASGYNVYRNREKADEEWTRLNSEPITETMYVDDTVFRNWIYYYRVSAVGHTESEKGDRVDIFSPQEDLYLPSNHRVSDQGTDFFTISWEWEGENPDGWVLFLKEEDDFDLLDPIIVSNYYIPIVRSHKFKNLVPGKTYYWRICARFGGRRGRMTDDLPGVTEGLWSWSPIEEVGSGTGPLTVVTADNDLSVTYLNGVVGEFGRRTAGTWETESVLFSMDDSSGGAVTKVDMAYGGGKYIIGGHDGSPGDVLAATGNPGSWEALRIDGNGSTQPGHALSGSNMQVAANEDSFFITYHIETYIEPDTIFELVNQMTPTGTVAWSAKSVMWQIYHGDSQYSLAATADNFHCLWYRREPGNEGLEFYSYDAGDWNMLDMSPAGSTTIGHYNDLTMSSGGDWFTPAYDPAEYNLYFMQETQLHWSTVIADGADRQGEQANMVAVGDRMFCVYKNRDQGFWMLAIYDAGVWEASPIAIPGAEIRVAKLAAIGDTPYLVFHDEDGDIIKCAAGTAPTPV